MVGTIDINSFSPVEHLGRSVTYECYPHLNIEGGVRIRGKIDGELIDDVMQAVIRTHPEDMKHPSLEGCSDYIPLEFALDIKFACPCGNGCEDSHDSRSYGPAFCVKCGDELDDHEAFEGVLLCEGCR